LAKYVKKSTGFKVNDEGYIVEDQNLKPRHEHGTAIAMIIRDICENVEFISVNILNERLTTDGRVLIHAFREALSYKPDIIHLSLGTTRWRYKFPLKRLVKEATGKDVVIVSAANNQGIKSYPAFIKGVVGVKGYRLINKSEFFYENNFFYAPIGTKNISGISELEHGDKEIGNSMAAAYITGHIAMKYDLKSTKGIEDFIEKIKLLSIEKECLNEYK
jgi:subtilisin family serine protease